MVGKHRWDWAMVVQVVSSKKKLRPFIPSGPGEPSLSLSLSLNFSESKLLILPKAWNFVLQEVEFLKLQSCGGKLDQRTNSGMEDSAMTIEFLRGRLLAERSVSKSARQRADELARRVEALEEQLKIVSLQRKKAEKATADVLAILENNGISDISETFDSSSDQEETPCESKWDNNSTKEDENSSNLKFRRNESGELSGSDHDFSPVPQRSLSWKGRKGTKHSPEKYKDSYRRRGSSFSSASSSPKHRLGKSCRQIKRKESRSMVEEVITDAIKVDSQANGVSASLEVSPNDSDVRPKSMRGGSEPQEEKLSLEGSHLGYTENEKNVSSSDMEKALEHQAQLNGKYEEMEKAQREWEERFRENNSSTPDSCDPGNQSDVTEEREEIKAQAQCPADSNNFELAKSKVEDVHFFNELSNTQSNGFVPPSRDDMQCLKDQKCCLIPTSESLTEDFEFPTAKEKHNQEILESNHYLPPSSSHNHQHLHSSPGNQSTNIVSSTASSSSGRGDVSGNQNELYALVPHEPSIGFNGVLESLKQARLSLQQKISSSSSTESGSVGKAIEASVPAIKFGNRAEIPVGFGCLFRLPTDFSVEASKANFLDSGSQPSLANYYPNSGLEITAHDRTVNNSYMDTRSSYSTDNMLVATDPFFTRSYMDTRSSNSLDDRLFTSQFRETGSRVSSQRPTFDRNLEVGLPSSSQYAHPTFSSYPDPMPQIPVREGFSTSLPRRCNKQSTRNPFSLVLALVDVID
ncbi:hypothetical protein Q3G72_031728 [Acer saccharum]|nr:hypothetical protein Q3G72_031728 [Acer saccharum]